MKETKKGKKEVKKGGRNRGKEEKRREEGRKDGWVLEYQKILQSVEKVIKTNRKGEREKD